MSISRRVETITQNVSCIVKGTRAYLVEFGLRLITMAPLNLYFKGHVCQKTNVWQVFISTASSGIPKVSSHHLTKVSKICGQVSLATFIINVLFHSRGLGSTKSVHWWSPGLYRKHCRNVRLHRLSEQFDIEVSLRVLFPKTICSRPRGAS